MPKPDPRGLQAIRAAWRIEIQPDEVATVSQLLAGLTPAEDVQPALRLAAAGRELIYEGSYLEKLAAMIRDGEIVPSNHDEARLVEELRRRAAVLVARIEEHLGAFPPPRPDEGESGTRETFVVELDPEVQGSARWLVNLAHQVGDAPEPDEPVGRMFLRAVGDDLLDLGRYLAEVAKAVEGGEFRELVVEIAAGCDELARAIADELPPVPTAAESAR